MIRRPQDLVLGTYKPGQNFVLIENFAAVLQTKDNALVAVTGPAGDPQSTEDALLFSYAPELLCRLTRLADLSKTFHLSSMVSSTDRKLFALEIDKSNKLLKRLPPQRQNLPSTGEVVIGRRS